MPKTATPKQTKITVSKLSHRLSRNGWISYNCELRKGRTTLAAVDQEGVGGDERVAWNNTEHYLLIHHWILDTQRDFWREYEDIEDCYVHIDFIFKSETPIKWIYD